MYSLHHLLTLTLCTLLAAHTATVAQEDAGGEPKTLRVGMIGLDTSHVTAFTRAINDPDAEGNLAHLTVTDAYPGGSPDIASSRDRVEGFTEQLRDMGVEMHDSIPEMLENVDVVMLESVDGRPHLEQVIPVLEAGKPVFIDKPLAGSLADAIAIARLAEEHGVPWFSSSSLRFSPGIIAMRGENDKTGKVTGVDAWGPCSLEPHHPDLFWYGVHGVEILFTIMGPGCEQVTRVHTDGTDQVTGVWNDGRVGTFRGIRQGRAGYGAMVFGEEGIAPSGSYEGYQPLLEEIAEFFQTGEPPIDPDETIEMFAFMEAADESKRRGGEPVSIREVMEKAQAQANKE